MEYEDGHGSSPPVRGGNNDIDVESCSEDTPNGAANSSIISKVRSRVSNILPNRLTEWFSPSAKTPTDSLNGNLSGTSIARRRRRIEIDDDDDDDEDEEADEEEDGDEEDIDDNNIANDDDDDDEEEEEEDGNADEENVRRLPRDNENSDEEDESNLFSSPERRARARLGVRRLLRASNVPVVRQPPTKRSRIERDITSPRDSPLVSRQPLVASTPTMGNNSISGQRGITASTSGRYLNLYGGQHGRREPPYHFLPPPAANEPRADDVNELVLPMQGSENSSRRRLNIPSFAQHTNSGSSSHGLPLKRQPLASMRSELSPVRGVSTRRTPSTIFEQDETNHDDNGNDEDAALSTNNNNYGNAEMLSKTQNISINFNGDMTASNRARLVNGTRWDGTENARDSASDSSECAADLLLMGDGTGADVNAQSGMHAAAHRRTGLFNLSSRATNTSSRNGSRTSSFGNGLNFHTHLEGRKSLFAGGGQHGNGATLGAGGGALNNSTLSLTSLNRRQFNASLYGSTSALSDSRLLNTFSPFYKGKTMYGGAAAYSARGTGPTAVTGAGASGALRIPSTLIRPTSSLSTLSSSSNSIAPLGAGPGPENVSTISSTTKRILDLINDFATPLSDAKKMANNVNSNQKQLSQTRSRLCDADVQAARAVRLSQVRTPYMRSNVILHPKKSSTTTTQLPPVRELQVPTMSQLVRMKRLQGGTEYARQTTATQNNATSEYTLPVATSADAIVNEQQSAQLQKHHTNKIKHKLSSTARATSTRDGAIDEVAPPPPNLQNIAFPLMTSVPKIDIALPTMTTANSFAAPPVSVAPLPFAATNALSKSAAAMETLAGANNISNGSNIINFKFSKPLEFAGVSTPNHAVTPSDTATYKFSLPTIMASPPAAVLSTPTVAKQSQSQPQPQPSPPLLKSGSVLDALRQPFVLPAQSQQTQAAITSTTITSKFFESCAAFGDQFKKSAGEWECDVCMLRNKNNATKCVACNVARKSTEQPSARKSTEQPSAAVMATGATSTISLSSQFGNQFKKAKDEWECDTCMLRNKNEATKCVACETPHKKASAKSAAAQAAAIPVCTMVVDPFKPQASGSNWECPTCLIRNKLDVDECAACQTRRPDANSSSATKTTTTTGSSFKFGFASSGASTVRPATVAVQDAALKKLAAAQMSAKWECEACMTRNDAARSKCVCCEQAKPGSLAAASDDADSSAPKFAFGTTAAAKFTFGFGGAATAAAAAATTADRGGAKTEASDTSKAAVNFVFGASDSRSTQPETAIETPTAPSSSVFTFGFKPTSTVIPSCAADFEAIATATTTTTKTTGTTTKTSSGSSRGEMQFKFGASSASSDASNTISSVFTFGAAPAATTTITNSTFTSNSGTATATATAAPSTSISSREAADDTAAIDTPSVKFNLPTANAAAATTTTAASASAAATGLTTTPATTTSFSFGSSSKTEATDATAAAAADPAKPQNSFSFASAAPKRVSGTPATSLGGFAFKPTATTSIGVVEPMFSFGSSAITPTSDATATTKAATVAAAATATATATSMPTFSFGSSGNSSSGGIGSVTVSKSVFSTAAPSLFAEGTATTSASTSTNVFGSFGSGVLANSATATTAPSTAVFGSSVAGSNKNNIENSISTNVTSTPTFGSFGTAPSASSTGNSSMFGAFGATTKPTAAATPLFGNNTSTNNANSSSSNSGAIASNTSSFSFGGSSHGATIAPVSASQAIPTTATNAAWSKSTFIFGDMLAAPSSGPTLFGAAAQSTPGNGATVAPAAPMFGNLGTNTSALAFGSTGRTTASIGMFGTSSTQAANAGNLFGSATAATTPAAQPAFGNGATLFSSSGGGAATLPAFGSVAAAARPPPPAFGSGAGVSANINSHARGSTTTDGASVAKKPSLSFSFGGDCGGGGGGGAASAMPTQSTGGMFNFGSAVGAKPSFNFTSTSAQVPAFNFTGNAETQAAQQTMHQQPFQFGAIASMPAPVFNFTSGHVEPTPNAPFQFGPNGGGGGGGAGSIPTNIFAPPVAGSAQQQVRRKIRTPMRRLPPR